MPLCNFATLYLFFNIAKGILQFYHSAPLLLYIYNLQILFCNSAALQLGNYFTILGPCNFASALHLCNCFTIVQLSNSATLQVFHYSSTVQLCNYSHSFLYSISQRQKDASIR